MNPESDLQAHLLKPYAMLPRQSSQGQLRLEGSPKVTELAEGQLQSRFLCSFFTALSLPSFFPLTSSPPPAGPPGLPVRILAVL